MTWKVSKGRKTPTQQQQQNSMKVTWKVHKKMKIGSKEWEENSEDVK